MKKLQIYALILPFLLFVVVFPIFKITFASNPKDIIVPDDYHSIQEAINAAAPGQNIYVKTGIYEEYLIINKSVSINGENASTTIIEGNGTHALVKITASNVNFSGFTIRTAGTGIILNNVRDCRIENSIIENISSIGGTSGIEIYAGGMGIYTNNSENVSISQNIIRKIYYNNIYFKSTKNSKVIGNSLIANGRWCQPVFLVSSKNNVIGWNDVLGLPKMNEGGVGLLYSDHNVICYNNISQNDWCGISIRESNYNIVKANNIIKHSWWGIMITNSHNVTVYLNNFIDNTIPFYLKSVKNITWSYRNLGNFWSDYNGSDRNKDGIGDTPYVYDGKEIDRYPLMGKFNRFEAKKGGKSYYINVISNFTINNFEFNNNTIKMYVSNQTNPIFGFCRLSMPKDLIYPPYAITIDNRSENFSYLNQNLYDNNTYRWIYFTCKYPIREIKIENTFPTDLTADGKVYIDDLIIAAKAFGSYPTHLRWNPDADINKDNIVNIKDLFIIAKDFGKRK